jgi:hypothetical protein
MFHDSAVDIKEGYSEVLYGQSYSTSVVSLSVRPFIESWGWRPSKSSFLDWNETDYKTSRPLGYRTDVGSHNCQVARALILEHHL